MKLKKVTKIFLKIDSNKSDINYDRCRNQKFKKKRLINMLNYSKLLLLILIPLLFVSVPIKAKTTSTKNCVTPYENLCKFEIYGWDCSSKNISLIYDSPQNTPWVDWNSYLQNSLKDKIGDGWNNYSNSLKKTKSIGTQTIDIYNPDIITISNISNSLQTNIFINSEKKDCSVFSASNPDYYEFCMGLTDDKLYFHTKDGNLYITSKYLPYPNSEILNYSYNTDPISKLFTTPGKDSFIKTLMLDFLVTDPKKVNTIFAPCKVNNSNCIITLEKPNNTPTTFEVKVAIPKTNQPATFNNEPDPLQNPGNLSVVATCLINYMNSSCPAVIPKNKIYTVTPINCQYNPGSCKTTVIPEYNTCIKNFFSTGLKQCINNLLGSNYSCSSTAKCQKCLTNVINIKNYLTSGKIISGNKIYDFFRADQCAGCQNIQVCN